MTKDEYALGLGLKSCRILVFWWIWIF